MSSAREAADGRHFDAADDVAAFVDETGIDCDDPRFEGEFERWLSSCRELAMEAREGL